MLDDSSNYMIMSYSSFFDLVDMEETSNYM